MIVKVNGSQSFFESTADVLQTSDHFIAASVPWYDVKGQILALVEEAKEDLTDFFVDTILSFLEAVVRVMVDLSYAFALVGGGILVLLGATTGSKRASKWSVALFMVHCLLTFIFA